MKFKIPVNQKTLIFRGIFLILLLVGGCSEWNNNPAETGKLLLNLLSIQHQLGIVTQVNRPNEKSVTVPQDTSSTSEVKALVVGALRVTSRDTPYSKDLAMTDAVEEGLKTDLQNSVDYFKIVKLPTADESVVLKLPPSTAGNWQPIAVGLRTVPAVLANLSDTEHKGSDIYYGFSSKFHNTDDFKDNEEIKLSLFRNCLGNTPPKGCATFHSKIDTNPIISASVEIIGVTYNGGIEYSSSSFPILVRLSTDETAAVTSLVSIRNQIKLLVTTVSDLAIQTTHSGNPAESSACRALNTSSSLSVAQRKVLLLLLKAVCETQEYKIKF